MSLGTALSESLAAFSSSRHCVVVLCGGWGLVLLQVCDWGARICVSDCCLRVFVCGRTGYSQVLCAKSEWMREESKDTDGGGGGSYTNSTLVLSERGDLISACATVWAWMVPSNVVNGASVGVRGGFECSVCCVVGCVRYWCPALVCSWPPRTWSPLCWW